MQTRLAVGGKAPDFIINSPWDEGGTFYQALFNRPAVVVFGRYLGCPICQLQMDDLKQGIEALTSKGAEVFYVLQSPVETVAASSKEEDWPFRVVCDPKATIFGMYQVPYGNFLKLLGPGLGGELRRMTAKGFKHGKFEGHETQLPAVFVVGRDKRIKLAHYAEHIVDMPSTEELAASLP